MSPIPGPSPLTRLLHLPRRARAPLRLLAAYAQRYGDVVRLDGKRYLINHPDLVEPVLAQTNRVFLLDNYKEFGEALAFWGQGLPISQGEQWQRQRRLIQPHFQSQALPAHAHTIVAATRALSAGWAEGQRLPLHATMKRLTLEIGMRTVLGLADSPHLAEIESALQITMDLLDAPTQLRFSVDTPDKERFRAALARLDAILYETIAQRRASGARGSDLLSQLLAVQEAGQPLDDSELRDLLVVMLRADHKNTATVLTWAWLLLGQHPAAAARLHAEVDGVPALDYEAMSALPYTEALFKETMRLYPLYAIMGRETRDACTIQGYEIPAGALLLISPWLLHRDPRFYETPDTFCPTRWLDGLETRLPKYAYFPFGGGPRLCLVAHYATVQGVLILATLAQAWRLTLAGPLPGPQHSFNGLRPDQAVWVRAMHRA